ncbi:hypothetical protein BH09SUM1_BH09SUM1_08080 [soil metagenome]
MGYGMMLVRLLPIRVLIPFLLILCTGSAVRGASNDEFVKLFGRGINLGNSLEAPKEGQWGVVLKAEYFRAIHEAGFRHVRVPISWAAHTAKAAPFTIDPVFLKRVDWVVDEALKNGLAVVVNDHHDDALNKDPVANRERFLSIWRQLAPHFQDRPTSVALELLNEPHDNFKDAQWNPMAAEALAIVRAKNPTRFVVIGGASWNSIAGLETLKIPEGDNHIVATFHYYDPFPFTHQGASWAGPHANEWLGTTWEGTDKQKDEVRRKFDQAKRWADGHGVGLYLGEFGAYEKGAMDSRVRWTTFIAEEASERGLATAYWEFCAGFGAYDPVKKAWREPLKNALVGR